MQQGKSIIAGILAVTLAGSAAGTAAPSASAMAECALVYSAAQAEMAKLTLLSTVDRSDDDADEMLKTYAVTSIRPFGFTATKFSFELFEDDYEAYHSLTTTVSASYDAVKAAMLRANGATMCKTEQGLAGSRTCFLPKESRSSGYVLTSKITEAGGITNIICTYYA